MIARDREFAPAFVRTRVGDGQSLFEMQFPPASVVIQAIGDVGVLLDFAQSDAGADRVNRARFGEERVARL